MSNPLLNPEKFQGNAQSPPTAWPGQPGAPVPPAPDNVPGSAWPPPAPSGSASTLRRQGVASAAGVLLALVCVAGAFGWSQVSVTTAVGLDGVERATSIDIPGWIWGGAIVGLVLVVATFFKPTIARFTAPLYAVAQGLVVGAISKAYEVQFDGIVLQAVGLTVGVFAAMLVLYATGRIRVTPRFRLIVVAATFGVMFIYLATLVMHLFGGSMPFIHDTGPIGIVFSLFVVGLAAMNLALDFDFIERAEAAGAPRHMEWFAALSLVVTIIWLYLELLRLLAKVRSN